MEVEGNQDIVPPETPTQVIGCNFRSGFAYFQNLTLNYLVKSDIETGSSSGSLFFLSFLTHSGCFSLKFLSSILPVKLSDLNTIIQGSKGEGMEGERGEDSV